MSVLDTPIERLVRGATAKKLQRLGVGNGWELLYHLPRRWFRRGELTPLDQIIIGEHVTVAGLIRDVKGFNPRGGVARVVATLDDGRNLVEAAFFARKHYLYDYYMRKLVVGQWGVLSGRTSVYKGRVQLVHPEFLDLDPDDSQIAIKVKAPIPVYPATSGLPSWKIHATVIGLLQTLSEVDLPDTIPANARTSHDLLSRYDALRIVHDPGPDDCPEQAMRTLKWEEALSLHTVLARARHITAQRGALSVDVSRFDEIVAGLPFTLRQAQADVLAQLKERLAGSSAMQVLLQADVGAGKTVIAAVCAQLVHTSGYQVAFLAPTEVLANQHARTFEQLLGVQVELLTAATPLSKKREITAKIVAGEPLIVVGTHALLNITIPNLGLAIVDEQHRFGVAQRDHLRSLNEVPAHMLVMTATPIPRTIAMTLFGDLEVIEMRGEGARTGNVATHIVPVGRSAWVKRAWQRVFEESERGGRIFIVVPRVRDDEKADLASIEQAQRDAAAIVGDERVCVVYGGMSAADKEARIATFLSGQTPVMVATTVIEVGIDVADATMMLIIDAERFGLAQLHQLRGRIGRGGQDALCLAMTAVESGSLAWQRLEAFANTKDGFELALLDQGIRDVGDIAADNQSGRSHLMIDVIADQELVAQAREVASAIVDADPDLAEHSALAVEIDRRLSADEQQRLQQG